jgi:hypothetical protein
MDAIFQQPMLLCPSAQPDMDRAVVFGIIGGSISGPRVGYLDRPRPVSNEVATFPEEVQPTEVFRIAAPCAERQCRHFLADRCSLASRLIKILPVGESKIPSCSIRSTCRWWAQEGKEACLRCPQVVTFAMSPSISMVEVATP